MQAEKTIWRCPACGKEQNTLIAVAHLVWLITAPQECLRVCAECHHRLTREKQIRMEAK
jgi:hypothetical protein